MDIKQHIKEKQYFKKMMGSSLLLGGSEFITDVKLFFSKPELQAFNDKYGSDIAFGMLCYSYARLMGASEKSSLVGSTLLGAGYEVAQYFSILPGTADSWDMFAYGVGGLGILGIDKAIEKRANKNNLEVEAITAN